MRVGRVEIESGSIEAAVTFYGPQRGRSHAGRHNFRTAQFSDGSSSLSDLVEQRHFCEDGLRLGL
jgi:hypothetical protein